MDNRTLAKLGRACRVLRELSGLSRARLATASGIHPNTLLRLEAGITTPTEATLASLADALGVSLATLARLAPHLDERGRLSAGALLAWIDDERRAVDPSNVAMTPAEHLLAEVIAQLDEPARLDVLAYAIGRRSAPRGA